MILGSNYAFSFSAPTLLKAATHWDSSRVGFFMSGGLPQSAPSACSAVFSARTYGAWREIMRANPSATDITPDGPLHR
jgi:hypothetical protein